MAAAAPSRSPGLKIPKMAIHASTLSNGLNIVSVEEHSSPIVAIQMWYHVGSKDDPPGRSGFAHLFEHLMFKGTKDMTPEMMDRLTEDIGGENNAETLADVTVYFEVVPSNYLETLLWAEGERLGSLKVDEANFKSERSVVEEELRQSVLAEPYGRLNEVLLAKDSFTLHPYKRPVIGSIEDLESASLADVRSFHQTYYRPENVTLVVVGDYNEDQLELWARKYLGSIPRPATPLPRVTVQEPRRTVERRFTEYQSGAPLPAILVTYLLPPKKSLDLEALQVAQAILSAGESSRLFQSLVYEQQVAASAEANLESFEDAGLFTLEVFVASGKMPSQAEGALNAEIRKLREGTVGIAELEKAKNQLIASQLRLRETDNGKAFALGNAAVLLGDPDGVNSELDRIVAVTPADVQRVAREFLSDNNRVVITYLPEAMRNGQSAAVIGSDGQTGAPF